MKPGKMKTKRMIGWLLACCAGGVAGVQALEPPVPVEPPKVDVQVEAQPAE